MKKLGQPTNRSAQPRKLEPAEGCALVKIWDSWSEAGGLERQMCMCEDSCVTQKTAEASRCCVLILQNNLRSDLFDLLHGLAIKVDLIVSPAIFFPFVSELADSTFSIFAHNFLSKFNARISAF
jgi:hypothetical protein